jgi:hypothetical protein
MAAKFPLVIDAGVIREISSSDTIDPTALPGASTIIKGTATISMGATPTDGATVTVTDASITSGHYVQVFITHIDTTADNTTIDHEIAASAFELTASPASGSFELVIHCLFGLCTGDFKIRYIGY